MDVAVIIHMFIFVGKGAAVADDLKNPKLNIFSNFCALRRLSHEVIFFVNPYHKIF